MILQEGMAASFLGSRREQHRGRAGHASHAHHADVHALGLDVLHHVQDGLHAVLRPRGGVDEEADILVRILVGQREELGADARGDVLVDAIADDDDAVEEEGGGESHRAVGGVHRDGDDAVVELLRADRSQRRARGGARRRRARGGDADADRGDRAGARAGDGRAAAAIACSILSRRPRLLARRSGACGDLKPGGRDKARGEPDLRSCGGYAARGTNHGGRTRCSRETPGRACSLRLREARDCGRPRPSRRFCAPTLSSRKHAHFRFFLKKQIYREEATHRASQTFVVIFGFFSFKKKQIYREEATPRDQGQQTVLES